MRQSEVPLTKLCGTSAGVEKRNKQSEVLAEMRSGSLSSWFGRIVGEPISAVRHEMEQRENHRRERKG
jgi:hypothetical protein